MKLLVTGATGFIGNYVLKELCKIDNYEIIASGLENYDFIKQFSWYNKVTYISCDLNEIIDNFFEFFNEPDILIHLSWQDLPNYKELYHFERNLPLNYNFLKNMIQNGLKDLNVIGTCLEYGLIEGSLSEVMLTSPTTAYGLAKDTLRKFLEILITKFDFTLKWIRLFYLYGKGQSPQSLLSQLDKALDENKKTFNMSMGDQLRDYLPVEKVAEYIVKIALQNTIKGVINCCSGEPISIKKIVETHLKKRKKNIKLNLGYYAYPDYEPKAFWGDDTKLKKILAMYKQGE